MGSLTALLRRRIVLLDRSRRMTLGVIFGDEAPSLGAAIVWRCALFLTHGVYLVSR